MSALGILMLDTAFPRVAGDVGAIVLECANMPPYTAAVKAAVGIPVFDAAQLIGWFHAGVTGTPIRHVARDLW